METKIKQTLILVVVVLTSCSGNLDFTGFLFPDDLVDSRFVQSEAWNKTHPFKTLTVNSDNYQLLLAADSHIGPTGNFDKFLTEAKKPENTAFVLVGDNVTGHKEDYDVLKNRLPDFSQHPYFLAVGNHDLYFDGWKTFYPYFGSSTYYFTVQTPVDRDLFIVLDSGSGTLGAKQLAWLKNVLSTDRIAYRNCVVFSHVNFFRNRHTGSTNPLVDEVLVLMDLFGRYHVNYVISGHDHVKSLNQFGFTTYITLGALLDNYSQASFLKLKNTAGKLGYEYQTLKGLN